DGVVVRAVHIDQSCIGHHRVAAVGSRRDAATAKVGVADVDLASLQVVDADVAIVCGEQEACGFLVALHVDAARVGDGAVPIHPDLYATGGGDGGMRLDAATGTEVHHRGAAGCVDARGDAIGMGRKRRSVPAAVALALGADVAVAGDGHGLAVGGNADRLRVGRFRLDAAAVGDADGPDPGSRIDAVRAVSAVGAASAGAAQAAAVDDGDVAIVLVRGTNGPVGCPHRGGAERADGLHRTRVVDADAVTVGNRAQSGREVGVDMDEPPGFVVDRGFSREVIRHHAGGVTIAGLDPDLAAVDGSRVDVSA